MKAIIYILCFFAAFFVSYTISVWLGLAVTAIAVLYGVYAYIPTYWAVKGQKAFNDGDFKLSERMFKKSVATGRAKVTIRINYAYTLMRTGKFDEAEKILDSIIRTKDSKLSKERINAKMQRCMVYFKQGKLDEALADALEMFDNGNYKNTQLYGMIGYFKLISGKSLTEATKFCEEAYDYNSDDRDIMDNLSLCYYEMGEYDKAAKLSDKIIKDAPKFVEAYFHGAQIAVKMGEYKKAKELMSHIDSCRWSAMTTVSHDEVDELNRIIDRRVR